MPFRLKIRVTPIRGEYKRFFVDSERPGKPPYLVDLDSYDGNGECRCKNFTVKCEPQAKAQLTLPKNQRWPMRCKHIKWAREYLLDLFLDNLRTEKPAAVYNREN